MDEVDPLRFLFSFAIVIGLIGLMAVFLKRYGQAIQSGRLTGRLAKWFGQTNAQQTMGRLEIIEMRYIDPRRKLVLVRCDQREHLLLLGDGRELVIESIAMHDER
jgi:flagellar protein FliO/FliZ